MNVIDFIMVYALGAVWRELIQFMVESVKAFKAAMKEEFNDANR